MPWENFRKSRQSGSSWFPSPRHTPIIQYPPLLPSSFRSCACAYRVTELAIKLAPLGSFNLGPSEHICRLTSHLNAVDVDARVEPIAVRGVPVQLWARIRGDRVYHPFWELKTKTSGQSGWQHAFGCSEVTVNNYVRTLCLSVTRGAFKCTTWPHLVASSDRIGRVSRDRHFHGVSEGSREGWLCSRRLLCYHPVWFWAKTFSFAPALVQQK